jgi:hypothetical protein
MTQIGATKELTAMSCTTFIAKKVLETVSFLKNKPPA